MAERFLVMHPAGMSSFHWWIRAESAEQIMLAVADVAILGPDAGGDDLEELDLADAEHHDVLGGLWRDRVEQRGKPGFGALAGRERVFLRQSEDDDAYLFELDADGFRVRQVEVRADGTGFRSDEDTWLFDALFDLYDPKYAGMEITEAEFERAWSTAVPYPD